MMSPLTESYTLDLYSEIAELAATNAALLEALRDTRRRLWERRFEFSDADHAAMDKATEAIRKATE